MQILPAVTPENEHFWRGGAEGELRFLYCERCRYYVHPPAPVCPQCVGKDLTVRAVSGRATVLTFTINHREWIPGQTPPYVIAIVELPEQSGLRLTTNIVGCAVDDVRIGWDVRVVFRDVGEGVFLPLFEPAGETGNAATASTG